MINFQFRALGALALAMVLLPTTPSCFAQVDLLYIGGANGTFSNTTDWDQGRAPDFQFMQDSITFNSASGATVDNDLNPASNGGVPLQVGLGSVPGGGVAGAREDSASIHFLDGAGNMTITGFPVQLNAPSGGQLTAFRVEATAGTTQTINNDIVFPPSLVNAAARVTMLNQSSGGKLVLNGDINYGTGSWILTDTYLDSPTTMELNGVGTNGAPTNGQQANTWGTGGVVFHPGNTRHQVIRLNAGDLQRPDSLGGVAGTGTIEGANGSHIILGNSAALGNAHTGTWENDDLVYRFMSSTRVERFNDGYADNNTFSTNDASVDLSEYGIQTVFGANWNYRSDHDTSIGWVHQVWAREDLNATNDNFPNPLHPTRPGRDIQRYGSVTVDGAGALTVAAHGGIFVTQYDGAEQIDLRLPGTSGEVAGANGRMVVNGKLYTSYVSPSVQTSLGTTASGGIQQGVKVPTGDAAGQLFIKPGQMVAEDGSLTNGTLTVSYGTITLNGDSGSTWKGSQYRAMNGSTTIIGHDNALGDSGSIISIEDDSTVDTGTSTIAQKFINTDGTIRGNGTLTNAANLSVAGTVQPGGETPSSTDTLTFDFSGAAPANVVQFESSANANFALAAGNASSTIDVLGTTGGTSINFNNNTFAFTVPAGVNLSDGAYTLFDGDGNTDFALGGGEIIAGLGAYTTSLSIVGDDLVLNLTGGGGLACDLDADGDCDLLDIEKVIDAVVAGTSPAGDIRTWLTGASSPANPYLGGAKTFVSGDADLDGNVNSTDLGALLNNFNSTNDVGWGGGDLNGDGNVNSTDLGALLNNFNFTSAAAASAVPEPDSGLLFLLAMGGLFASRRRRK